MVSGPGATRRSTSLVSTASPRATEPNTRTSRKPRRDAAARICPRAARRDPRSGDRSCCSGPGTTSPFPVPHATRVLARYTEPEDGTFRVTSCRASQPAATRVAQSCIRLASQASSPSSPSRHARPARQLLYVTGQLWRHDKSQHRCRSTAIARSDIETAGGAGGARTHDRRIMRSTACCTTHAGCTDDGDHCTDGTRRAGII